MKKAVSITFETASFTCILMLQLLTHLLTKIYESALLRHNLQQTT